MDKKYQVFVSSTFLDLIEERQEVMKAMLELDCIPVGMELFPADDDEQWKLIKRLIENCDYYIVIIGGKYGSLHKSGASYTEMEYRHALKKKIPIIGFIIKNPENLPLIKSETDTTRVTRLNNFKAFVQKKLVNYWTTPSELGGMVSRSLIKLTRNHPRAGWIKADQVSNEEAIKVIFNLTNEVESLSKNIVKLQKNETLYKNIIRSNIVSFGNLVKDTKNTLYHEMFHAVDLSFKYSVDNLNLILEKSLQIISDALADVVKNQIRTKEVDDDISVTIKAFVDAKRAKKILENDADPIYDVIGKNEKERFIITLARDSKTKEKSPDREVRKHCYRIGKNSDFTRIVSGQDFFLSNDLQAETEELGYINENSNWQKTYNATTVVPIYYQPSEEEDRQIFGFLTVDSMNVNKEEKLFTKKDTVPILEFGAELLTIIFLNLGLFENKTNGSGHNH